MADFEFTVGEVSFEDAKFGAAFAEKGAEFVGGGATVLGFDNRLGKGIVNEAGGSKFFQQQFGVAFVEVAAAGFEQGVSGAFGREGEAGADLDSVGA